MKNEWRPIEEYDGMDKKPDNCLFLFRQETQGSRNTIILRATVQQTRYYGNRIATHFYVYPEPPK